MFRFARRRPFWGPLSLACALVAPAAMGCSHAPASGGAAYVRAQAVADPPPPAPVVVRMPPNGPQPGQLKPRPRDGATSSTSPTTAAVGPQQVVAEANRRAAQAPARLL